MIRAYAFLTKPGIIAGNILTTASGFILASKGNIHLLLFLSTVFSLSLVVASACVFNNFIDRKIDEKMVRTKNRALVKGQVSPKNALVFASFLGILGLSMLLIYTNVLTAFIAFLGFVVYVFLYSISKYHTIHAALIGSFSGAVPPVVGYCAVSGRFDLGALLLFLIVMLWQMPHFFAIAMYRLDDYIAASIPVWPAIKGEYSTKVQMLFYIIAFTIAAFMPTFFGYTGYAYLLTAAFVSFSWLYICLQGFSSVDDRHWAKKMFLASLVNIAALCCMISLDVVYPKTFSQPKSQDLSLFFVKKSDALKVR